MRLMYWIDRSGGAADATGTNVAESFVTVCPGLAGTRNAGTLKGEPGEAGTLGMFDAASVLVCTAAGAGAAA